MSGVISTSDETLLARAFYVNPADANLSIDLWRIRKGKGFEYVVWNVNHDYGERGGRSNGSYCHTYEYSVLPCRVNYEEILDNAELAKLDYAARKAAYKTFLERVQRMVGE